MPNLLYRVLTLAAQGVLPVMTTHTHASMARGPCPCVLIAVKSEQNDAALVVNSIKPPVAVTESARIGLGSLIVVL